MAPPILLVEDDLSLAQALTVVVEGAGIPVEHCATGETAIELLAAKDYPLIVVDIILSAGEGMSGIYVIKAARRLRKDRRPAAIIITGGNVSLRGIDRSVVSTVLFKPLNLDLFRDYVVTAYRHALAQRPELAQAAVTCASPAAVLAPFDDGAIVPPDGEAPLIVK